MENWQLALVGVVFLLAGTVKGVSGMGLPTVAMALLGLVMAPATAAALLLLPSFVTNVVQCQGRYLHSLARRLWPAWLGLVALTVFSPLPDVAAAGDHAKTLLGTVLLAYGLWGLARPRLPQPVGSQPVLAAAMGALTGIVTAATGVFVLPLVPYLQALRLSKDEFVQALGLSFTLATVALAIRLGGAGASAWPGAVPVAIGLMAAIAGIGIGARLRGRMSAEAFQTMLFAVFIMSGLIMLARTLTS
jgi:uncharacterized protein